MRKSMKLSLKLDQLTVESFEIAGDGPMKGTVRGNEVCSDMCTASCDPTCGILPVSAESECAVIGPSAFCDTGGICNSDVCCV